LTPISTALFTTLPLVHLQPWDLLVVVTLVAARAQPAARRQRVGPLLTSIRVTLGSLAVIWVWGVIFRGGNAYQTMFQLHYFIVGLLVAHMLMATCRSVAHIKSLGKVIFAAAIYRSLVLLAFYVLVASDMPELPPTMTSHGDTPLFVLGALMPLVFAAQTRTLSSLGWLVAAAVPICTAIQLNNRRIAWLAVEVGAALSYWLLRKDKLKRRINAVLIALAPVAIAYVVVGWGHPTGIFKPVGSISSMFGQHEDTSSQMRNIENYNLVQTLKSSPILGIGWGKEYHEIVVAYSIAGIFPQYRYMPHNSLLGVLAFTGMLGFVGVWQLVPVASYFLARGYHAAETPVARTAGLLGILSLIVCSLQMWGDVGFNDLTTNVLVGASIAVAGRLPVLVGAWPGAPAARPVTGGPSRTG
ncbi:MAG TPA: O-antigen ligase family protein, partial [Polyangiaceae bacterium]|nr:O-antigen ligase family protein [Polyangiaceae bacterium]